MCVKACSSCLAILCLNLYGLLCQSLIPSWTGRDGLERAIDRELKDLTPRRILLSGLGGVGKTELSVSLAEKFDPKRYVLWFRATDSKRLEDDFVTIAEDLRHELLRFDRGNHPLAGEDPTGGTFYFSPVPMEGLVSILKRWIRASPDDGSRLLVVLDDLDGLEPSQQEKYSMIFAGEALNLIYTARDPSMADSGMLWEAMNYDVPSLDIDDAVDMLALYLQDNHSNRKTSDRAAIERSSRVEHDDARTAQLQKVAKCLGALPAAIAMGSYYMKDALGFRWKTQDYREFLDSWNQDKGKRKILQSHRAMLKYRHSVLGSFEVSMQRLRRNINKMPWHDTLEGYCWRLLHFLSAMDIDELSRDELPDFKSALRKAAPELQSTLCPIPAFTHIETQQSAHDFDVSVEQCLTELVKVSLLTERLRDGTFLLNSVTKACALLVPNTISADAKAAAENSAEEILGHWKRKDAEPASSERDISDLGAEVEAAYGDDPLPIYFRAGPSEYTSRGTPLLCKNPYAPQDLSERNTGRSTSSARTELE